MMIQIDLGSGITPERATALAKLLITGLTPVVIWLVKEVSKSVPKKYLAALTPFIGIGFGAVLERLGVGGLDWQNAAEAGGLGVLLREVYNQLYGKKAEAEKALLEQRLAPTVPKS